jgi:hypothetical protein
MSALARIADSLGTSEDVAEVPCVDRSELARAIFTFAGWVGATMCSALSSHPFLFDETRSTPYRTQTHIRRVSLGGPRPNYPEGFDFDQKLSVAKSHNPSVIKSIFIHYLPWDLQWR